MLSVCLVNCIHKNLRCKVTHYFLKKEEKGYLLRGEVRGKKYEVLSMKEESTWLFIEQINYSFE